MAEGTAEYRSTWGVGSQAGAKSGSVAVSGVGPQGPAGPTGPTGPEYTLTAATANALGGVKVGKNLAIVDGVLAASPTLYYSVKDYGATGDGSTDDTTFIQACEDAARTAGVNVFFPKGTYRTTATVTFGADGVQSYRRWFGAGRNQSKIRCEQDDVGVRVKGMFGGGIDDLAVERPAGMTGTHDDYNGIGIWMANSAGGFGTGNTGNVMRQVKVSGWTKGWMSGDVANTRAASELVFVNCEFTDNDVGYQGSDSNTLNQSFVQCGFSFNRLGLDAGASGSITVKGGTASFNREATFSFGSGGNYSIADFRHEDGALFLYIYSANDVAPTSVTMADCHVSNTTQADGFAIWAFGCFTLSLDNCDFNGKVGLSDFYTRFGSELIMRNVGVADTEPFRFYFGPEAGVGDRSFHRIRYQVQGCYRLNSTMWMEGRFADESGVTVGERNTPPDYGFRHWAWKVDPATSVVQTRTAVTYVTGDRPAGDVDGVNDTFTTAYTPASLFRVWLNGLERYTDQGPITYSLVGSTITFSTPPSVGDDVVCDYLT